MGYAVRLVLLGDLQISRDGLSLHGLLPRKGVALLVYLIVTGGTQPRERLAALLWGDAPERAASASLRQTLTALRQHLGDTLLITRNAVSIGPEHAPWCDVALLEAGLAEGDDEECLRAATTLYGGDFLSGVALPASPPFEEWALTQRARLRELALEGFRRLAAHETARGAHDAAAITLRRLLQLDPWDEAAHRQLMLALASAGQRGAALAQYEEFRQQLAAELGLAPDPETARLRDHIRQEAPAPTPAPTDDPHDADRTTRTRHNLAASFTSFVGREAELARLAALLREEARLVTIVGAGGSGKTRLALAAAWATLPVAPDGVWWVALAGSQPASDPVLARATVAGTIATALGLPLPGQGAAPDELGVALRERAALLVLDNCEHLPEVAAVVRTLLEAAPALRVLATSRAPLGLDGETLLRLGGLPVPDLDAPAPDGWAGVRLFVARARQQTPGWEPDTTALRGTARLVRLLDGLPLAIELAAGWVGHYTPDEIADEIASDPDFLAARGTTRPDRHRSLRAAFDYSWRLLGEAEQTALRRLAIFQGGFDRAAVTAVAAVRPTILAALADRSLLYRGATGRYSLHELVRQFAHERLLAAGEAAALGGAHTAYYLALAEEAAPLVTGPEQAAWLARLDRDADNLHAALGRARAAGEAPTMLRLTGALARFWTLRGHMAEGHDWFAGAFALPGAAVAPAAIRARALYGAGVLASDQGDHARAEAWLADAVTLYHTVGDLLGAVRALNTLGGVAFNRGDLARAATRYEECLALARAAGDAGESARALGNLGETWLFLHDERAAAALDEALTLARAAGRRDVEAYVLGDLGTLARRRGNLALASARHREALALHRALGALRQIAITLEHLAALAATERRGERVARLLGAATALRAAIGAPRPVPEQRAADEATVDARTALGDEAWLRAFAAGEALPLAAALDEALA